MAVLWKEIWLICRKFSANCHFARKQSVSYWHILPFYRKESYWMAEKSMWLVNLQENRKTDKDHVVIIDFLCTTCINNGLNNFCLVVEYDIFTENTIG